MEERPCVNLVRKSILKAWVEVKILKKEPEAGESLFFIPVTYCRLKYPFKNSKHLFNGSCK